MELAPNRSDEEGATSSKEAHLSLLRQRHNIKGMTQLSKVKQNIHQHTDKSCNLKKHKKSNSRPNRAVWTVFVNCAHWRGSTLVIYNTVLIIFPLNLQTITITLDVVKWRWGGHFSESNRNRSPEQCSQKQSGIIRHKNSTYRSAPKATIQTEYNNYCATDSYNAWPGKQDSFGDTLLFPGKSLFPRSDDIVATCM